MAAQDGRTARWAGHRDQRRAALVEAAITVIEQAGPGATVDQVAASVGVTRQAVYRQFSDRADLDRAVAAEAARRLVADLLPHLGVEGDIDDAVRRGLTAYVDHVQAHLHLYRFVRAHEAGEGAVRQVKDSVGSVVAARARALVPDAAPGLAETVAIGLVGMADAVLGQWVDDPRGLSRDQVVEALVVLLGGAARAAAGQVREGT